MNGSPVIKTDVILREDFASSAHNDNQKPGRKKRMPPLSIRLSPEERTRLEFMAGNRPIGAFVKSRVFAANDNVPPKGYSRTESARILGLLARMDVFPALNGLLRAAGNGQVQLEPEMEAALTAACLDLAEIRCLLITAQGIKAE